MYLLWNTRRDIGYPVTCLVHQYAFFHLFESLQESNRPKQRREEQRRKKKIERWAQTGEKNVKKQGQEG